MRRAGAWGRKGGGAAVGGGDESRGERESRCDDEHNRPSEWKIIKIISSFNSDLTVTMYRVVYARTYI